MVQDDFLEHHVLEHRGLDHGHLRSHLIGRGIFLLEEIGDLGVEFSLGDLPGALFRHDKLRVVRIFHRRVTGGKQDCTCCNGKQGGKFGMGGGTETAGEGKGHLFV